MDVSDLVSDYETTANNTFITAVFVLGGIALVTIALLIMLFRQNAFLKRSGGKVRSTGMLSVIIVAGLLSVFAFVVFTDKETIARSVMLREVASRASDYYEVDVSHEVVWSAWEKGDDEMVKFQTDYNGSPKSLGVTFDREDAELVVYEGSKELEPVN